MVSVVNIHCVSNNDVMFVEMLILCHKTEEDDGLPSFSETLDGKECVGWEQLIT